MLIVPATLPHMQILRVFFEEFGFRVLTSFEHRSVRLPSRFLSLRPPTCRKPTVFWRIFVAVDFVPRPPNWRHSKIAHLVDNARLSELKKVWAHFGEVLGTQGLTVPDRANLYYSPTSEVARDCLAEWEPRLLTQVEAQKKVGASSMKPKFPVITELNQDGFGRDARTYLVRYGGTNALLKVYRPGRERFVKNNVLVAERLGHVPEINTIIDWGPNWVVLPYIENAIALGSKETLKFGLIPISTVRHLSSIVHQIHDAGIAHLDFHASHVLRDLSDGLHVIDFDRIHVYGDEKPTIQRSVMLAGYDQGLKFDGPPERWSYARGFERLIGLSCDEFLRAADPSTPSWRLRARVNAALRTGERLVSRQRKRAASLRKVIARKSLFIGRGRTRNLPD